MWSSRAREAPTFFASRVKKRGAAARKRAKPRKNTKKIYPKLQRNPPHYCRYLAGCAALSILAQLVAVVGGGRGGPAPPRGKNKAPRSRARGVENVIGTGACTPGGCVQTMRDHTRTSPALTNAHTHACWLLHCTALRAAALHTRQGGAPRGRALIPLSRALDA